MVAQCEPPVSCGKHQVGKERYMTCIYLGGSTRVLIRKGGGGGDVWRGKKGERILLFPRFGFCVSDATSVMHSDVCYLCHAYSCVMC